eukprot:scaffold8624_cov110-Isochrysis_galbana.AAC.5
MSGVGRGRPQVHYMCMGCTRRLANSRTTRRLLARCDEGLAGTGVLRRQTRQPLGEPSSLSALNRDSRSQVGEVTSSALVPALQVTFASTHPRDAHRGACHLPPCRRSGLVALGSLSLSIPRFCPRCSSSWTNHASSPSYASQRSLCAACLHAGRPLTVTPVSSRYHPNTVAATAGCRSRPDPCRSSAVGTCSWWHRITMTAPRSARSRSRRCRSAGCRAETASRLARSQSNFRQNAKIAVQLCKISDESTAIWRFFRLRFGVRFV